jgi:hypothetical protein
MQWTDPTVAGINNPGDLGTSADWNTFVVQNTLALRGARKRKLVTTIRNNNATAAADPELTGLAMKANTLYAVRMFLRCSADAAADLRIVIDCGSGSGEFQFVRLAGTVGFQTVANGVVMAVDGTGAGVVNLVTGTGWALAGGSDTGLSVFWAQFTAQANNATMEINSWVVLDEVS